MKELSIEEKAKRYDEAIDVCRKLYNKAKADGYTSDIEDYEQIFPELKESEDERIRKAIINVFASHKDYEVFFGASVEDILAWLERQGEQEPINPDTLIEQRLDALADIIAEQKPADKVEPKFKVGDKIQYLKGCGTIMTIEKIENGEYIFGNNMGHTTIESGNKWHLIEQKPAWSEEDEKRISSILLSIEYCKEQYPNLREYQYDIDWLKSLKDRVVPQQKKEWSEEDDKTLNEIFSVAARASLRKSTLFGKSYDYIKWQKWLKSLRPQNTWKPSDGQMKALEAMLTISPQAPAITSALIELYEQLKKL